jgi:hypothetical protein
MALAATAQHKAARAAERVRDDMLLIARARLALARRRRKASEQWAEFTGAWPD